MKPTSFWIDTASEQAPRPRLEGEAQAEAGTDVVLLEAGRLAQG